MRDIADSVTHRWQQLVTRAEERHKLVTASLNFYTTAEQVRQEKKKIIEDYSFRILPLNEKNIDTRQLLNDISRLIEKKKNQNGAEARET